MVFTGAQTTAFFENNAQMAIPHDTVIAMEDEGIEMVEDLAEFDKDTFKAMADNLRNPGGRIPNPDPNASAGSRIARPPYVFGAKSRSRLTAAADLVRYYLTTGRDPSPANMRWSLIIVNFKEQWKALQERKDDDIEVPRLDRDEMG